MRIITIAGIWISLCGSVAAHDCTPDYSGNLFTVQDWSVVSSEAVNFSDGKLITIDVTYKNAGKKGIAVTRGQLCFYDSLDTYIGCTDLDTDPKLAPGENYTQKVQLLGLDRLLALPKKDVDISLCFDAVQYDDGTKEEFK